MNVAQVATLHGISQRTVYRDIDAGRLRATRRADGRLSISTAEARRYRAYGAIEDGLYVTVSAATREWPYSVRTLRRWIAAGRLKPMRIGRRLYVPSVKGVDVLVGQ